MLRHTENSIHVTFLKTELRNCVQFSYSLHMENLETNGSYNLSSILMFLSQRTGHTSSEMR